MPVLSQAERNYKLRRLADAEGFETIQALLQDCMRDSVCWAICCNANNWGCDFTAEVPRGATDEFCENCQTGTMVSALVLAGLI